MNSNDIFVVPIQDKILLYSPLQKISALVNPAAAYVVRDYLFAGQAPPEKLKPLCSVFDSRPIEELEIRSGPLVAPVFLGLIPGGNDSWVCPFSGYRYQGGSSPVMPLKIAKKAVDAYFDRIIQGQQSMADIRIYGGEDFPGTEVIFFAEAYARRCAREKGLSIHLELITEGGFSTQVAGWLADHFDQVVLFWDGENDSDKNQGIPQVEKNAQVFSEGQVDLVFWVKITKHNLHQLQEMTEQIIRAYTPKAIQFDTCDLMPLKGAKVSECPDPLLFAREFTQAAHMLEAYGILPWHARANSHQPQISFCPVGKDALIVTPGGHVNTCILPEGAWREKGLPFQIGKIAKGSVAVDYRALNDTRASSYLKAERCEDCFCLFHCAGGCPLDEIGKGDQTRFDNACIQTRLVTLSNLLREMGQYDVAKAWLDLLTPDQLANVVVSDRLRDLQ